MLGNPAPDGLDIGKFLLSSLELDSADLRCSLFEVNEDVSSVFDLFAKN